MLNTACTSYTPEEKEKEEDEEEEEEEEERVATWFSTTFISSSNNMAMPWYPRRLLKYSGDHKTSHTD